MRRRRRRVFKPCFTRLETMIALSILVLAQEVLGSGAARFPVPRAQEEFAKLGPHVRGYCGAIEGDNELFRRAVLPFGPMDLTVAKGTGPECEVLRNLYLGFVGVFCKVDAAAMAQRGRPQRCQCVSRYEERPIDGDAGRNQYQNAWKLQGYPWQRCGGARTQDCVRPPVRPPGECPHWHAGGADSAG